MLRGVFQRAGSYRKGCQLQLCNGWRMLSTECRTQPGARGVYNVSVCVGVR